MTDPSYAGQIITFTFPHIGNVGANPEDIETTDPGGARRWCCAPTSPQPSNWRAAQHFDAWLKSHDLVGIAGVDTRRLTRRIRDGGAPNGALCHAPDGRIDVGGAAGRGAALARPRRHGPRATRSPAARATPGTRRRWVAGPGLWPAGRSRASTSSPSITAPSATSCACWRALGCRVTVVPATASGEDILRHQPDGVFLSNGPGDPAATGAYAVPVIRAVLATRQADLRHLPRPSAAGAGARRQDAQDGDRPSRRQSSGQGPRHRQGRDHQPESRLLRAAGERCRRAPR